MYHNKKHDDYESISSINPLYLIIAKADGYMKESNWNKYLVFTSTNGIKNISKIYKTLGWSQTPYWGNKLRLKRWVWKRFHEKQIWFRW